MGADVGDTIRILDRLWPPFLTSLTSLETCTNSFISRLLPHSKQLALPIAPFRC